MRSATGVVLLILTMIDRSSSFARLVKGSRLLVFLAAMLKENFLPESQLLYSYENLSSDAANHDFLSMSRYLG
jgi:hypothetical protein